MKTNWQVRHLVRKRPLQIITTTVFIVIIIILWWLFHPVNDPVPITIRHEVSFSVLYPTGYTINPSSWQYSSSQQTLNFIAQKANLSVTFTEQQVPLAYLNDTAAYDRFIGSLKPSATFNTSLGSVSLTTFVFAGDFQPDGTTGILNTNGTLLFAHPSGDLTAGQWLSLFNSLKVSG
jgi:hypothetical protein